MKAFSALLAICTGKTPATDELPEQRPVARSFDVFYDLRRNKWLRKTMVRLVIWDAIAPIMTSLLWLRRSLDTFYYNMFGSSLTL